MSNAPIDSIRLDGSVVAGGFAEKAEGNSQGFTYTQRLNQGVSVVASVVQNIASYLFNLIAGIVYFLPKAIFIDLPACIVEARIAAKQMGEAHHLLNNVSILAEKGVQAVHCLLTPKGQERIAQLGAALDRGLDPMTQAQVATLLGNAALVAQDIRERFEDGHSSSILGLMIKIPSRQPPALAVLVSRTPSPLASPGVQRPSPTLSEASDPVVGEGQAEELLKKGLFS